MADNGQDQLDNSTDTDLDRLIAEVGETPEEAKTEQVVSDDPDAIEEAAARKALADEEAAGKAEVKASEKTEEGKASEPEKGKETEAKTDTKTPMIPKPRFDEVAATAAYWKGIADERGRALAAKAEPAAEDKPTPEQQLQSIEARRDALAAQVDDGKLLMSDFVKEDRKLKAEEEAIRDTLRKVPTEQPKRGSDLYLEERTAKLEQDHPYVVELSPDDLAYLTRKAVAELGEAGIKLPKGDLDPADQLVLRTKIAELSDRYGPVLTGKELKKQPATAGKPAMSKEAQQREAKLAAAASAPPDLTAAGRSSTALTGLTEERVMAMTEAELEALPAGVLDKFMGRNPS